MVSRARVTPTILYMRLVLSSSCQLDARASRARSVALCSALRCVWVDSWTGLYERSIAGLRELRKDAAAKLLALLEQLAFPKLLAHP